MSSLVIDSDKVLKIFEKLAEEGGGIDDVGINKFGVLFTREQRGPNRGKWTRHGLVNLEEARAMALDFFTFFA